MKVQQSISAKLSAALRPALLDVVDESHRHAGHSGARPGGETHYSGRVVSEMFVGRSRVQRHRIVYDLLAEEISGGVHALAIDASTPDELARRGTA